MKVKEKKNRIHMYFLTSPSGQDPVNPGLSNLEPPHQLFTETKYGLSTQLLISFQCKQVILTPFPLTGNCKELNFLSQIRVLLGTIIDTSNFDSLYVLTLARRNRELIN